MTHFMLTHVFISVKKKLKCQTDISSTIILLQPQKDYIIINILSFIVNFTYCVTSDKCISHCERFTVQYNTQIAFRRWANIGPTSAHPSVRCWPNGFLTVGPTLARRWQATGKNYILCIASANQIMFTNNFFSVNL